MSKTEVNFIGKLEYLTVGLVLAVLVYVCYSDAVHYGLLKWDSHKYIVENKCIHGLDLSNISCIFTRIYFSNWHPFTSLSYALEYEFFGENPKIHHITNIVIHFINSLLVYIVAKSVFLTQNIAGNKLFFSALIASILFAVHPQHVESVVWVSERKGLLSALFFLLSVWFYIQYVTKQESRTKGIFYSLSLIGFLFSLLSKSVAITMPVLLLLIDIYPLNRLSMSEKWKTVVNQMGSLVVEKIPFFIAAIVMVSVTIYAQLDGGSMSSFGVYALEPRLVNAIYSVFFYVGKWFLPLGLSPYYSDPAFLVNVAIPATLLVVTGFLATIGVTVRLWMLGNPVPLVLSSFVVISLLPVLGIITVGTHAAADRYSYIPLIPLYFLAGHFGAKIYIGASSSRKWLAGLCFALVVFSLISVSRIQATIWRNDTTLWTYVTRGWTGSNTLPLISLANAYFENGNYIHAITLYQLARSKGYVRPRFYLGLARSYGYLGKYPNAMEVYNQMLAQEELEDEWKAIVRSDIFDIRKKISNTQRSVD